MAKLHTIKPKSFDEVVGKPGKKELPSRRILMVDLPETKEWRNGEMYEILEVVKQIGSDEDGITVETHKIAGGVTGEYTGKSRKRSPRFKVQ